MQWGDCMAWRDVVFQYDGTFEGFLCCVFDSYVHKEFPIAFFGDEDCCTLYEVRFVTTDKEKAQRIYNSIKDRSKAACDIVRRCFLTCLNEKERHLYTFIRKLYQEGAAFIRNPADEVYHPIACALRHLNGELEKLRGFVRFSDYSGVLGAEIEPKNRVLPLLRYHFCARYAEESFFIYDRTHKELLVYAKGHSRILQVDNLQLALPGEEEVHFRMLWRRFFNTISIEERHNPRCQNTFLPKRYRGTMTEFLPDEPTTTPPEESVVLKGPFVQGAISAPETLPGSLPSVVG
jgi:probable DNA metabolism protein